MIRVGLDRGDPLVSVDPLTVAWHPATSGATLPTSPAGMPGPAPRSMEEPSDHAPTSRDCGARPSRPVPRHPRHGQGSRCARAQPDLRRASRGRDRSIRRRPPRPVPAHLGSLPQCIPVDAGSGRARCVVRGPARPSRALARGAGPGRPHDLHARPANAYPTPSRRRGTDVSVLAPRYGRGRIESGRHLPRFLRDDVRLPRTLRPGCPGARGLVRAQADAISLPPVPRGAATPRQHGRHRSRRGSPPPGARARHGHRPRVVST